MAEVLYSLPTRFRSFWRPGDACARGKLDDRVE
jgi:hypothetical protein